MLPDLTAIADNYAAVIIVVLAVAVVWLVSAQIRRRSAAFNIERQRRDADAEPWRIAEERTRARLREMEQKFDDLVEQLIQAQTNEAAAVAERKVLAENLQRTVDQLNIIIDSERARADALTQENVRYIEELRRRDETIAELRRTVASLTEELNALKN